MIINFEKECKGLYRVSVLLMCFRLLMFAYLYIFWLFDSNTFERSIFFEGIELGKMLRRTA